MRSLSVFLAAFLMASSAHAEDLPSPSDRFRLELVVGGERHFATLLAETPSGAEQRVSTRLWTGGFDVCPAVIVRPWLDLGACLGLHIGGGQVPGEDAQWFADETPAFMGRAMVRSVFRAPRFLRGGVDLAYRSFVGDGRESALEVGLRLGVEYTTGGDLPLFLELAFRAPLVVTRSESTFAWPREDMGLLIGYDVLPTRDVRVFTLGIQVGAHWSVR